MSARHDAHRKQAEHNEELLEELKANPKYHDWAIVVAFYAALHHTTAYMMESHGLAEAPKNHMEQRRRIDEYLDPDTRAAYKELQSQSEEARYRLLHRVGPDRLTIFLSWAETHLEGVKNACA